VRRKENNNSKTKQKNKKKPKCALCKDQGRILAERTVKSKKGGWTIRIETINCPHCNRREWGF